MSIIVKFITGNRCVVDITVDTTLEDIAEDIKDYIETPKFIYQGEVLNNHKESLADLGICPESVISAIDPRRIIIIKGSHPKAEYSDYTYYIIDEIKECIYSIDNIEDIVYCDTQPYQKKDDTCYIYYPYGDKEMVIKIKFKDKITVSEQFGAEGRSYKSIYKETDDINIRIDEQYMEREKIFMEELIQDYPQLDIKISPLSHDTNR